MNKSFDICYVIAHGFAARMLFQTGLVTKLTQKGKRIAIITPDISDDNIKALSENSNIEVFEASADTNIWDDDYLFKRKYYLEDIKANPALWEKHIQAVRYNTSKHPWRRVRPFYYYLIYWLIGFFPSIRERFERKEHRYLVSKSTSQLIEHINPQLVISTYPVSLLEAKVLYAAQQLKIKTCIHLLSWDNISCKGKFPVLADEYIAWGPIMEAELKEYYQIPQSKIHTCGVPHFDQHVEVKRTPAYAPLLEALGLAASQPYIFVAMSSPYFAPKEIDIVEWIAEAVHQDRFGANMQLIIRPHPQNVSGFMADKSWLGRLKALKSKHVAIDYPKLVESKLRWSMQQKDMYRLSNLLVGCTVCLNSGSTVSIDALMCGKPSILTSFDANANLNYWKSARRLIDYNHLAKFIKNGGATPVFDFEALANKIQVFSEDPNYELPTRIAALKAHCLSDDGLATERVVAAVTQMLDAQAKPTLQLKK